MVTGSVNRIPMIAMSRKNCQDRFNPFAIFNMCNSVDMGKDVGIMPVGFLIAGSVGMMYIVVLRFKRVWQVSDLLFPYRFEYRIVGLELVDPNEFSPKLPGVVVVDQHTVAEKFLADGGAGGVDCAEKTRAFWVPARKYAPFLLFTFAIPFHLFKFVGKFISKFRQHVHLEEFIGDSVPAEVIMFGDLSLDFDEVSKASAAFPTAVALKLYHSNIHFMLNRIIKIGI
jgi:hypothetical protein